MFSVEQALTIAGDNPMNEDVLGWTAGSAWVIDGATPLGEPYMAGGLSSATWFAVQISDSFRSLAAEASAVIEARDVMTRTQSEMARRLVAGGLADTAYPPSASAAYLAVAADVIEVAIVGDVEVLVTRNDGKVDTLSTNLTDVIVETDAGLVPWGSITDKALQRRAILNDRGFSNVLTLAPLRGSAVTTQTLDMHDVALVLLVSDGFTRLRDLGKHDTLIAMARGDIPIARAAAELRDAEHQFPARPPDKISDDATAIMLSFPHVGAPSRR